jgi:putative heme-binding domain-containing protein
LALLKSLQANPGINSVPAAVITTAFQSASQEIHEQLRPLLDRLTVDLSKQGEHVDELLANLPPGDIRRGQTVFNSTEAACITCHEIGYLGGNLGPDLTSIGQARSPRDLLESIMFPSASFVRSYESVSVKSKDGTTYLGIVGDSSPETLTLRLAPTAEIVLKHEDILEQHPATVSLMPQGIHTQLTKQQLADLLAFLNGTRWR